MTKGTHIILRDGIYTAGGNGYVIRKEVNGSSWDEGDYNMIKSADGEWAILDGENNIGNGILLGSLGALNYWKFERLEFTRARSADGLSMKGFLGSRGPFIFRYCYFHDNLCDVPGGNPSALSGSKWYSSLVEYCYFKNNGHINTPFQNKGHILIFGDSKNGVTSLDGFTYLGAGFHTEKNIFRYNLFEGGGMGIRIAKETQIFSGRTSEHGYDDTYLLSGDQIHNNILLNLGHAAMLLDQDFQQIHRNIIYNCAGGGILMGLDGDFKYKQCVYNNTIYRGGIYTKKYLTIAPDKGVDEEKEYHVFIASNIIDSGGSTYNTEELSYTSTFETSSEDYTIFSNNYSYRPNQDAFDPTGTRPISFSKNGVVVRYTASEWNSLRPNNPLWINAESSGNALYQSNRREDAAFYKTSGAHIISGSVTIANGGIGGEHPYLDGVVLPSYVGATNPSDNAWVDGVLGLADLSNLINGGPGDPWWVEGGSGNHAPELSPIGNRSVPVGEQIQITVEATDADGDTLEYTATGN